MGIRLMFLLSKFFLSLEQWQNILRIHSAFSRNLKNLTVLKGVLFLHHHSGSN